MDSSPGQKIAMRITRQRGSLPLVVGPEDRAEHLVLAWILRRAVPHERDHFRPPVEAAEEKVLPLQFPKERLIGAILELLFEPFTVFMSSGA